MQIVRVASPARILVSIEGVFLRVAVLMAICCSVANAQAWYIGAGAGPTNASNFGSCSNLNGFLDPGFACHSGDTSFGWKLFAGHEINRYLAVEASYVDLGEFKVSGSGNALGAPPGNTATASASDSLTGFSLDALGTWPVNEQVSLIGRAGIFIWHLDASVSTSRVFVGSVSERDNPTGTTFDVGVGVKYDIDKRWGVRAELQRFGNIGNDVTGRSDFYLISGSVFYRFRSSFY